MITENREFQAAVETSRMLKILIEIRRQKDFWFSQAQKEGVESHEHFRLTSQIHALVWAEDMINRNWYLKKE